MNSFGMDLQTGPKGSQVTPDTCFTTSRLALRTCDQQRMTVSCKAAGTSLASPMLVQRRYQGRERLFRVWRRQH